MSRTLKPCPFCGASAYLNGHNVDAAGQRYFFVECSLRDCGAATKEWCNTESAVNRWDERVSDRSKV